MVVILITSYKYRIIFTQTTLYLLLKFTWVDITDSVFLTKSDLSFAGDSVPFKGHKYDYTRRGLSANAIVSSTLLSLATKGSTYSGEIHV